MSGTGRARAEDLLAAALAASSADDLEVCLAARTSSVLRFAGGRVHQPQDLTALQIMVRAVVGDRSARVAVSSPALLGDAVARACTTAATMASPPAPARRRRAAHEARDGSGTHGTHEAHGGSGTHGAHEARGGSGGHGPRHEGDGTAAGLWFDATAGWDAGRRAAEIVGLHRAAGAAGPGASVELSGTLAAGTTELAVATSRGTLRYAAATEASLSLTARCDDGSSHAEELGRDAAAIDTAATGAGLIADAVAMRGAGELPAGRYDVVFGPAAVAELIGFLPAFGFTAPAVAAGIGVVAAGTRVLSPLVTVADDATTGPGLPWPFDMEGTTKRRVELVGAGRLGDVVSDRASGAVTGGSTGHAHIAREEAPAPKAANLRLEVGTSSTADLLAGVGRGVYVQRLWYTRLVDAATGVITGTTRDAAFEIVDGRLGRPVAGMRFSESVLDALERVDGVGDATVSQPVLNVWNGAASAPAVRVRGFRLGVIGGAR